MEAGADLVNDVSGGQFDPAMLPTVAALRVPFCLMHMRGTPQSMGQLARYSSDPVRDVAREMQERVAAAEAQGVLRWDLIADPGIGFAKDFEHNLALLRGLRRLREELGRLPLLVGVSRKRFIGTVSEQAGTCGTAACWVWERAFPLPLLNPYHSTAPIRQICDEPDPAKRDLGTSVANALAIAEGAAAVRVHNVPAAVQAARLADTIAKRGGGGW